MGLSLKENKDKVRFSILLCVVFFIVLGSLTWVLLGIAYRADVEQIKDLRNTYLWATLAGTAVWLALTAVLVFTYTRYLDEHERAATLRKSVENQRILLDSIQTQVWYLTDEHTYGVLNKAHAEFNGVTVKDLAFKNMYDVLAPDVVEVYRQGNIEVFETGKAVRSEEWIPHTSGKRRLISILKSPHLDRDGNVNYVICSAEDITERKQAEEGQRFALADALQEMHTLRESALRYRELFENNRDGLGIVDVKGNFIGANQAFCHMVGYTLDELEQIDFYEITPQRWHDWEQKEIVEKRLLRDGYSGVYEKEYIRKDGSVFPVELQSHTVFEQGKPQYLVGIARDISKRKQAEVERENLLAQVREQAKRIQQTIDTVPEGVLLLDANGRVILTNPTAVNDLFFLAGAKVGDVITHLGDHPLAEILTSPSTKGLWHEVKVGARTFEVIARPMESSPDLEDWVLVINDVTQERAVREQLQQQERLAAVGQLAAGIAHDFNNIMAVIVLYTNMGLRQPDLPAPLRQQFKVIGQQAKRATNMIQQIMDFSRRTVLERRPMDLTPFLKEVVKLLKRTVPESITLELIYGVDEYTVHADPTRMQQTIINLAVNARDAMPEGGELHIELDQVQVENDQEPPLPEMETGEWVRVRVTDTGSGIPPNVLPHIFEPFFTTKEMGKGTGLGLAQVYGIVKQHEGHIDVSTQVGVGTTFTLYLPALPTPLLELPDLKTTTLLRGQGETLLVVEDSAPLRQALTGTLEQLNYRVLEATNGREALEMLEKHEGEISLVLSDLVMPEMGGGALFHALQQRGLTLPVVMLSGHPLENELENLEAQGMAGWLVKPPNLEQLSQLLVQALNKQKQGR